MRIDHLASIALIVATGACGATTPHRASTSPATWLSGPQNVIGRWALVTLVVNGVERTNRTEPNPAAVRYYTFDANGRFQIALGDSVGETGTWLEDTTVSPKVFDHIPDVNGKPGPYVPGIFAITGDTLTIAILPPNPARRHPTQLRSSAADSSWLLVFTRARR